LYFISTPKFRNERTTGLKRYTKNMDETCDWSMQNPQIKAKEISFDNNK